jgi:phage protein D
MLSFGETQYGVRPKVDVDGSDLSEDVLPLLESVTVDGSLHLADMVELVFHDGAGEALSKSRIKIGSVLKVSLARPDKGDHAQLIEAEVTALESDYDSYGTRIIVRGYDHAHRLSRGRRTCTYNNVTDADIVKTVAGRAGLTPGDIASGGPTFEHVSQVNSTDWEFLVARGRETGHEVAVTDGKLHWREPADASGAPSAASGLESTDSCQLVIGHNLIRFRPRVTAAAQVPDVEVRGWDPAAKEAIVATAPAATTSATVGLDPAGLASTFDAPTHVAVNLPLSTQQEADAAAKALAETLASAHAEADGVALGDPAILPGTPVSVTGAGDPFDGTYTVTATRHIVNSRGYRTEFVVSGRAERSLLGLSSAGATNNVHRGGGAPVFGVVIAMVTDVNDPDHLGRVKLKFPWLSEDYESWWCRITQIGAGADRGGLWLPEVNDEVLVAFEHGDTRRPYVVGQLFNGVDKPKLGDGLIDGSTGAVKRRGFISKLGHQLTFLDDDSKSGIAVVSADASLKISLNQSKTTIKISADGNVEITGSKGVKISSGADLSIKASGKLELNGKGVSIDGGSGNVEVKGTKIALN